MQKHIDLQNLCAFVMNVLLLYANKVLAKHIFIKIIHINAYIRGCCKLTIPNRTP